MPFSSLRKGLQEFLFGVAEKFHIGTGLAAAEHGAKGDRQDVCRGGNSGGHCWRGGHLGR